jgi:hypothetical protein
MRWLNRDDFCSFSLFIVSAREAFFKTQAAHFIQILEETHHSKIIETQKKVDHHPKTKFYQNNNLM